MPTIDVIDLSFSYSARPLLDGVSLSVGDGERAVLVGPNGSGKTTLLRLVLGDISPDRGAVGLKGIPGNAPLRNPAVRDPHNARGTGGPRCTGGPRDRIGLRDGVGTVEEYLNSVLSGPRAMLTRFTQLSGTLAEAPDSVGGGGRIRSITRGHERSRCVVSREQDRGGPCRARLGDAGSR